MIIGIGVDLVTISRFEAMPRKDRLAERILTPWEHAELQTAVNQGMFMARAWAVKEAVAKSFGTGITGDTIWKNIELRKSHLGQPTIHLLGSLYQPSIKCHVSISHDGDMLIANAVLEHTN